MVTSFVPASIDIVDLVRGDTASFSISVLDDDGSASDLTGYTATAGARTLSGTDIAFTAAIVASVVTVTISAAQSALLELLNTAQVEVTDGSTVRTVGNGTIATIEDIL